MGREEDASIYYNNAMMRVKNTKEPQGQKFHIGQRVFVSDLPGFMLHFKWGYGTIKYTYAHAFGGENIEDYCIDFDEHGESSWYPEYVIKDASEVTGNEVKSKYYNIITKEGFHSYAKIGEEKEARKRLLENNKKLFNDIFIKPLLETIGEKK